MSQAKKAKVESTTTKPNWLELPRDLTSNILQKLGALDILTIARNVCPYWWNICKHPFVWRKIDMGASHLDLQPHTNFDSLAKLCQYAIDLSSGHLEEIHIYRFGNDHLLKYIAHRASHLRCIKLDSCEMISDEGWCEVAKKFPLLEEVDISHGFLSNKTLEVIGHSCPLLKSLTFYGMPINGPDVHDAFVIAKTMTGLRHLDIHGNRLSNAGLLAILDDCPLLESLNIEDCGNLDISESLWKRLNSQIKDLHIWEEDCSDPYYDNVELEFAFADSNGNSYWDYVEKFDEDDEDEDDENLDV